MSRIAVEMREGGTKQFLGDWQIKAGCLICTKNFLRTIIPLEQIYVIREIKA